ncbi:hypothetical protein HDU67_010279 [Dinochytrium kinnereticum]|nr:hypothetical protein HDU67_010279 [Dinochytrium kinnereticum]
MNGKGLDIKIPVPPTTHVCKMPELGSATPSTDGVSSGTLPAGWSAIAVTVPSASVVSDYIASSLEYATSNIANPASAAPIPANMAASFCASLRTMDDWCSANLDVTFFVGACAADLANTGDMAIVTNAQRTFAAACSAKAASVASFCVDGAEAARLVGKASEIAAKIQQGAIGAITAAAAAPAPAVVPSAGDLASLFKMSGPAMPNMNVPSMPSFNMPTIPNMKSWSFKMQSQAMSDGFRCISFGGVVILASEFSTVNECVETCSFMSPSHTWGGTGADQRAEGDIVCICLTADMMNAAGGGSGCGACPGDPNYLCASGFNRDVYGVYPIPGRGGGVVVPSSASPAPTSGTVPTVNPGTSSAQTTAPAPQTSSLASQQTGPASSDTSQGILTTAPPSISLLTVSGTVIELALSSQPISGTGSDAGLLPSDSQSRTGSLPAGATPGSPAGPSGGGLNGGGNDGAGEGALPSSSSSSAASVSPAIIAGIVCGVVLLAVLAVFGVLWRRRRNPKAETLQRPQEASPQEPESTEGEGSYSSSSNTLSSTPMVMAKAHTVEDTSPTMTGEDISIALVAALSSGEGKKELLSPVLSQEPQKQNPLLGDPDHFIPDGKKKMRTGSFDNKDKDLALTVFPSHGFQSHSSTPHNVSLDLPLIPLIPSTSTMAAINPGRPVPDAMMMELPEVIVEDAPPSYYAQADVGLGGLERHVQRRTSV